MYAFTQTHHPRWFALIGVVTACQKSLMRLWNIRILISLIPVTQNGEDTEAWQNTSSGIRWWDRADLIVRLQSQLDRRVRGDGAKEREGDGVNTRQYNEGTLLTLHCLPCAHTLTHPEASSMHHLYIRFEWFSTRVSFTELCQLPAATYIQSSGWVSRWPAGAKDRMTLLEFRHDKYLHRYSVSVCDGNVFNF